MSNGMSALDSPRNMTQGAAKFIRVPVGNYLRQVVGNGLFAIEVVSDVEGDEFVRHRWIERGHEIHSLRRR